MTQAVTSSAMSSSSRTELALGTVIIEQFKEEGEVTHVIVTRDLPFSPNIVIRVYVNGPRNSGFVEADAQGTILAVNVS